MIIVLVVLILCILIYIYNDYYDKLKFANLKLSSINEKLKSTLIKRKSLIKESETLIKEIVKTNKQIYEGFDELNDSKLSLMELDKKLLIHLNEFYLIKDKYKKLQKNEEFQKLSFAINETGDLLDAYKEYYNKIAEKYNKLIKVFPFIIINKIKGNKELNFFDKKSINDNDYNDFKY